MPLANTSVNAENDPLLELLLVQNKVHPRLTCKAIKQGPTGAPHMAVGSLSGVTARVLTMLDETTVTSWSRSGRGTADAPMAEETP